MAATLMNSVLKCTANLRNHNGQPSSRDLNLSGLSPEALAAWATEHASDFNYRVELARRIALSFDAEQIILLDDIGMVVPQSERISFHGLRACDRSLLPGLWLSAGFKKGARILVKAPPNPVEMENFVKLKYLIDERVQRKIDIRIFFEDERSELKDLLDIFEKDRSIYMKICESFTQRSKEDFNPEYHVDFLKRHFEEITKDVRCSFVFPYETTEFHREQLKPLSDRLKLADCPVNDKAKHSLFLRSKGFDSLPKLIAVSSDGRLIDNYNDFCRIEKEKKSDSKLTFTEKVERFSHAVVEAIDRFHRENISSFVKLDASGAAGWSCLNPKTHPIVYDPNEKQEKRREYLKNYIKTRIVNEDLPDLAVVEQFVEAEKRDGDIDADYTVCGFVVDGLFFPTSINLCGTIDGSYVEQWTSSTPADLNDSSIYWQRMFHTYSTMVSIESKEFSYRNGIYAGDLFISKDGRHKQRDWNIRRGGRSSPEALTIFGIPNYETKIILSMNDFQLNKTFSSLQLFRIYTQICQQLYDDYGIYVFSTGYGYCCKDDENEDLLKFNVLIHPKWLKIDQTENPNLPRSQYRQRTQEIVRKTAENVLQRQT